MPHTWRTLPSCSLKRFEVAQEEEHLQRRGWRAGLAGRQYKVRLAQEKNTCNGGVGEKGLQVGVELLSAVLHKLYAVLLAEDALGRQAQPVGGQLPKRAVQRLEVPEAPRHRPLAAAVGHADLVDDHVLAALGVQLCCHHLHREEYCFYCSAVAGSYTDGGRSLWMATSLLPSLCNSTAITCIESCTIL